MTWYATSWQHMETVRTDNAGNQAIDVAKAIDNSYPYRERSGLAYKAWLAARRDFFRKHNLPLRRAKKQPAAQLFELQSTQEGEA